MRAILVLLAAAVGVVSVGCGGPTGPDANPEAYQRLVQLAGAESRAQEDSTFLWLRNVPNAEARSLMLDLGLDYVRYDRIDGVVCAWAGGGMGPARGFVYRLPGATVPIDSLGETCYRYDTCGEERVTDTWTRFWCE
jgi:hypothetical protein